LEVAQMRLRSKEENRVRQIPLVQICPGKAQPRKNFSNEELLELARSIQENGVLQPLTVRKAGLAGFELIAGERRLRAAALAGSEKVPCLVIDCDDQQAAIYSLLENLQRVDLDPFEEAEGIEKLIQEWHITQEEAAKRLGKKQSTIANKLRLLRLAPEEREAIQRAGLTERHARAVLKLKDGGLRSIALRHMIERGLNVKQTEDFVERLLEKNREQERKSHRRIIIKDVRIFMNTINKAVDTMRLSGIDAFTDQKETEEYIECVVRIPKAAALDRHSA
jgi:hypothetical protein